MPRCPQRSLTILGTVLSALVGFAAVGCSRSSGSAIIPTAGRVLVNGKPAADALVVFNPTAAGATERPSGRTDADGQFKLTTNSLNDGAPAGVYNVTVEWKQQVKTGQPVGEGDPVPTRSLLPASYATAATTPVQATVKPGGEPHEIVITTRK